MNAVAVRRRTERWALFPLRLIVGYGFLAHGLAKWNRGPEKFAKLLTLIGTPHPELMARVVTLIETLGGLAIIVGAFVVIASVPLAGSMIVAMATIHVHYGFSSVNTIGLTATGPVFGPPGYEINLLYIGALAAIAFAGAGPLSVDQWRRARRSPVAPSD
jgi:putative oxidoreductase